MPILQVYFQRLFDVSCLIRLLLYSVPATHAWDDPMTRTASFQTKDCLNRFQHLGVHVLGRSNDALVLPERSS
jgi:hypothetical protein